MVSPSSAEGRRERFLTATTLGHSVEFFPVLHRDGALRVSIQISGWAVGVEPAEGTFLLIALPREGVKTLDGEPLAASGPED